MQQRGLKLPDWYQNCPEVTEIDEFFLRAFWDLSTCRSVGMSVGPIPWRDMSEYARVEGLDPDVRAAFIQVLRQLDVKYLDWHRAQEEKKRAS